MSHDSTGCSPSSKVWYKNKIGIVLCVIAVSAGLSYIFPILIPLRQTLGIYLKSVWWAVLLGLTLGGMMEYYVPRELISHVLAGPKKRTIFYAVGLGFFASVCSHGILAISMELYKKGAATASVVAFLLASPWANISWSILIFSLFGLLRGLYIIIVALIVAVTTGLIYQILEKKGWVEKNARTIFGAEGYCAWQDFGNKFKGYKFSREQLGKDMKGIASGAAALGDMVLWWILIGILLASLSGAYIPQEIFKNYMGPTITGLLVTLALATVLEVCSEGMAPLSFEIFRQTGALGNSLVFLMAGVATDYTEIGLLWQNIGKKTAIWLPVIAVPQIVFWGMIANLIF